MAEIWLYSAMLYRPLFDTPSVPARRRADRQLLAVICSGGGDRITYPGLTQPNLTYERMKVSLKTWKSSTMIAIPKCYEFKFEMNRF